MVNISFIKVLVQTLTTVSRLLKALNSGHCDSLRITYVLCILCDIKSFPGTGRITQGLNEDF